VGQRDADDEGDEQALTRVALRTAMGALPRRERRIVYLRFFEDRTQAEIGAELGISQMHVSRLLRASLATLSRELGEDVQAALVHPST